MRPLLSREASPYAALDHRADLGVGFHGELVEEESVTAGEERSGGLMRVISPDLRQEIGGPLHEGRPFHLQRDEEIRMVGRFEREGQPDPGAGCLGTGGNLDQSANQLDKIVGSGDVPGRRDGSLLFGEVLDDTGQQRSPGAEPVRGGPLRQAGPDIHACMCQSADPVVADLLDGSAQSTVLGAGHTATLTLRK